MLKSILGQLESLWRHIEQAGIGDDRAVLVVSTSPSLQLEMRVFAIQEGWRILFAKSLANAIRLSRIHKITVVVYDQDLSGVSWHKAFSHLQNAGTVLLILLSTVVDWRLRKAVLDNGGFDVARMPVQSATIVPLVNGAFALAGSVDSAVLTSSADH